MSVVVTGEHDPAQRVEVIKRRLAYEQDADTFIAGYQHDQEELAAKITQAKMCIRDRVVFLMASILFLCQDALSLSVWNTHFK